MDLAVEGNDRESAFAVRNTRERAHHAHTRTPRMHGRTCRLHVCLLSLPHRSIGRPRQLYQGQATRDYVPSEDREESLAEAEVAHLNAPVEGKRVAAKYPQP